MLQLPKAGKLAPYSDTLGSRLASRASCTGQVALVWGKGAKAGGWAVALGEVAQPVVGVSPPQQPQLLLMWKAGGWAVQKESKPFSAGPETRQEVPGAHSGQSAATQRRRRCEKPDR